VSLDPTLKGGACGALAGQDLMDMDKGV